MKHLFFLTLCLLSTFTLAAQTKSKANELFLKAQELDMQHNFTEAVSLYEKAKVEIVNEHRKDSVVYANCLTNIGRCYYMLEDYRKAAQAWEEALPRYEKFSDRYERVLEFLGFAYQELGDTKNMGRVMVLVEEHNQHELTLPCDEPGCMTGRGEYYAAVGENAKAKEFFQNALSMLTANESKSEQYLRQKADTYSKYAKFLGSNMRDYASGAENYLAAANVRKTLGGIDKEYIDLMYSYGLYSFLAKENRQAIDAYGIVLDFYKGHKTAQARDKIARCYKYMGNAYIAEGEYEKGLECFNENLLIQEGKGAPSEEYAKALERVATAEKFSKQYDSAIEHYRQSIAMYQHLGKQDVASSVSASLNLCYIYAGKEERVETDDAQAVDAEHKKLREIIRQETEDLELTKTYLGELQYAGSLATIAGCYYLLGDYDQSVDFYEKYVESLRVAISKEFALKNENERMHIWVEQKGNIDEILEILVRLPAGKEYLMPRVCALAYDVELLSKGILLKSSIEFEDVLKRTNNNSMMADYAAVKKNEEKINSLRLSISSEDDLEKVLALTRENESLMMNVMNGCAAVADYTKYLSYSWKDVQSVMKQTDVSIEFASIQSEVFDRDNYMAAIVLTKEMEHPVAVPVCNLEEADAMAGDSLLFETPVAGDMVWGCLLRQYIEGKDRIFFSADGCFNSIGIEYLMYEGKPFSEQFEVYRLSSTKELCYDHSRSGIQKVALFGNIDYYEEGTFSDGTDLAIRKMKRNGSIQRGSLNGKFIPLDNTKDEIIEIDNILKTSGIDDVAMIQGTEASETAFLKLNDSDVNILHIATHGTSDSNNKSTEEESMQNCALVFAGANIYGEGDICDGLITAAEVSGMNLRSCELAVLSACESGLGKLSGDGVFGLQRGFKNAGVKTMLMSLKPVYDISTKDLMVSFYKELAKGRSKREALVEAQKSVRLNYGHGKYWAPFILLDGLD